MQVWELEPGRLLIAGGFSDLALHHHAAVQVTAGTRGPLTVTCDGDSTAECRLVVIASGAHHAVRSDSPSAALTLYLGLQTPQGAALNTLSRNRGQHDGVWIVENGRQLAERAAAALAEGDPHGTAELLVDQLCEMTADHSRPVHPQLRQAMEVISTRIPERVDLTSVADAVALSPDYLGRLCRQQNGISFSATIRWERLVAAVNYLLDGYSVTDAAHLAGFADGSHANKVCWEMTGATPRELADAVRKTLT